MNVDALSQKESSGSWTGTPPSLNSERSYVRIQVIETAKEDLREGWKFYEKSSAGLGDYFLCNGSRSDGKGVLNRRISNKNVQR